MSYIRLALLPLALVAFAAGAYAQPAQNRRAPESADQTLERLSQHLNLSAEQRSQIRPILEERDQFREQKRAEMEQRRAQAQSSGQELTREDRRRAMDEMRDRETTFDSRIRAILTPEQVEQYRTMMREQRDERRGEMRERGADNDRPRRNRPRPQETAPQETAPAPQQQDN